VVNIPQGNERKEQNERKSNLPPTEVEVRNVRQIFAYSNELFVKNIIIDPLDPNLDNIDKATTTLAEKYPAFDFRFEGNYLVHESGLILDHKNYARWINNPEADAYAVYARPKGQKIPEIRGPKESTKMLMDFIAALSGKFTLIEGDREWKEKVIKSAQKLWGNAWRENLAKVSP
jgi:hypothetical protein